MKEIYCLRSNQREAHTRIGIYLHYAEKLGFKAVVVRTIDLDLFIILLLHAHEVGIINYLDTGLAKHRQLINISELVDELSKD